SLAAIRAAHPAGEKRRLSRDSPCAPRTRCHPSPAGGGWIGGLRPPFSVLRTPMRSIGYGSEATAAGWGALPRRECSPPASLSLGTLPLRGPAGEGWRCRCGGELSITGN